MEWHPSIPTPDESWGSVAYENLGKNIGRLGTLLDFLSDSLASLGRDYRTATDALARANERLRSTGVPSSGELLSIDQELSRRSLAFKEASVLLNEWQVVMGVTMVETYLEDVLADAAKHDSTLMTRSEQAVTYTDTLVSTSLPDLQDQIRHRWSRNFVDDGGPKRWIERLQRMGARCFGGNLADDLEGFWGIRHVVVHSAGRVTADFVRRHSRLNRTVGTAVAVTDDELIAFSKHIVEFSTCVDRFLCARSPALRRSQVAV